MIAFVSLLAFISFSLFIKTQQVGFILPSLSLIIYFLYQKKHFLSIIYLVFTIVFVGRIALQKQTPIASPTLLMVIESRATYAIGTTGLKRYHVQQNEITPFALGDIIRFEAEVRPLIFQSYESRFNFKEYLHTKGVYHSLILKRVEVVFASPFDLLTIQKSYIDLYPVSLQPYVSQLLFNYSDNSLLNEIYLIFISGLGFSMMFDILQKPLNKRFPNHRYLPFLFLFPYVFMHLHRFSILRVYLFKAIDHALIKKTNVWTLKISIIFLFLFFFPHLVYQTGFYLYIAYQCFFKWIVNIIPRFPIYYRTIALWIYTTTIQHLFFKAITPLSILIYIPLSYLNSLMSLTLLAGFYLKLHHPIINHSVTLYKLVIEGVQQFSLRLVVPQWSFIFISLVLILVVMFLLGIHYQSKKTLKISSLTLVMMFALQLVNIPGGWIERSIHFINVGQGDATLIRHGRHNILVDTGGQRNLDIATEVLIPYFKSIGVWKLDAVIITHGDFDHDGALPSLIENFRVEEVIRDRFKTLNIGELRLIQWNTMTSEDENDNSLVLSFTLNSCSVLLMGDASVFVEEAILETFPMQDTSILRIGHHGSLTSTSELFLDTIQPKTAIISVSATNSYGHPHPTVIERLARRNIETMRTDIEGTIVINSCKI